MLFSLVACWAAASSDESDPGSSSDEDHPAFGNEPDVPDRRDESDPAAPNKRVRPRSSQREKLRFSVPHRPLLHNAEQVASTPEIAFERHLHRFAPAPVPLVARSSMAPPKRLTWQVPSQQDDERVPAAHPEVRPPIIC
jgi:hypothetical protein